MSDNTMDLFAQFDGGDAEEREKEKKKKKSEKGKEKEATSEDAPESPSAAAQVRASMDMEKSLVPFEAAPTEIDVPSPPSPEKKPSSPSPVEKSSSPPRVEKKNSIVEPEVEILSVSDITFRVKRLLEETYPEIWVCGELSNVSRPKSGHVYLTLKDDKAQLSGVMWRNTASKVQFDLQDGLEVVVGGRLTLYPSRGKYQIIIEKIEPKGVGALQLAFEQLKAKLEEEGLFDKVHKKPLPMLPAKIGIITSGTGAALRDMLKTIYSRFPSAHCVIYPVRVQGEGAREEISQAISDMNALGGFDVLITGRGGGSLEDLWAFNEEVVARAIFASVIPVISAVGHEVDYSISDLVADYRAPTPTAAGEVVVPRYDELAKSLEGLRDRLASSLDLQIAHYKTRLESFRDSWAFRQPSELIRSWEREVDDLGERILRASGDLLGRWEERLADRRDRLFRNVGQQVELYRERVKSIAGQMDVLSPLKLLERGFSATTGKGGEVVKSIDQLDKGDEITTRLADGEVISKVEQVVPLPSDEKGS